MRNGASSAGSIFASGRSAAAAEHVVEAPQPAQGAEHQLAQQPLVALVEARAGGCRGRCRPARATASVRSSTRAARRARGRASCASASCDGRARRVAAGWSGRLVASSSRLQLSGEAGAVNSTPRPRGLRRAEVGRVERARVPGAARAGDRASCRRRQPTARASSRRPRNAARRRAIGVAGSASSGRARRSLTGSPAQLRDQARPRREGAQTARQRGGVERPVDLASACRDAARAWPACRPAAARPARLLETLERLDHQLRADRGETRGERGRVLVGADRSRALEQDRSGVEPRLHPHRASTPVSGSPAAIAAWIGAAPR